MEPYLVQHMTRCDILLAKKNRINLLLIEYDGRVNDNILVDRQPA